MIEEKSDFIFSCASAFLNTTMIHNAMGKFSKMFWNPDFWLPVNFTWEDIQPRPDFQYPNNYDILKYPIFMALVLLFIRYWIVNPYIFYPIAKYYRLNLKRPPLPKENKKLDAVYKKYNCKVPLVVIDRVAEDLKWKASDVHKGLKERKAHTRLTVGEKFSDSGFMLLVHCFFCFLGFYVLFDKKWPWNITLCWYEYPHHEVDGDVWFYYMFGISFYLSTTLHQLLQPSRKDRLSIYLHHVFTISLMSFSWIMNLVRAGSLILVVHQCVDWLLLSAKLFHYLNMQLRTNIVFGITIVVWIITRLIIFPLWILRSALFEGPTYMFMPSAYLFYALLLGLLLLNFMWMAMMLTIIVRKFRYGILEDVRSSDEMSDWEEIEDRKKVQ